MRTHVSVFLTHTHSPRNLEAILTKRREPSVLQKQNFWEGDVGQWSVTGPQHNNKKLITQSTASPKICLAAIILFAEWY